MVAWERRAVAEAREARLHQRVINSEGLELVVLPSTASERPVGGQPPPLPPVVGGGEAGDGDAGVVVEIGEDE